jgi:hypothetical protein
MAQSMPQTMRPFSAGTGAELAFRHHRRPWQEIGDTGGDAYDTLDFGDVPGPEAERKVSKPLPIYTVSGC